MYFCEKPSPFECLMHYGVKGMKWGVRRTPEELGHVLKSGVAKSSGSSTIISDAISSGLVSKTVNKDKQVRHTKSGRSPGKGFIYGDVDTAQELIDRLAGTGQPVMDRHGEWTHKERVSDRHIIGETVDPSGPTNLGMIVYSKTGSHIYPIRRKRQ